jgi:hypothetical protein
MAVNPRLGLLRPGPGRPRVARSNHRRRRGRFCAGRQPDPLFHGPVRSPRPVHFDAGAPSLVSGQIVSVRGTLAGTELAGTLTDGGSSPARRRPAAPPVNKKSRSCCSNSPASRFQLTSSRPPTSTTYISPPAESRWTASCATSPMGRPSLRATYSTLSCSTDITTTSRSNSKEKPPRSRPPTPPWTSVSITTSFSSGRRPA